jgi:predicted dehydrogenase
MTKKLRIGVIGCANIAEKSVIPAIKKCDEFQLIAIASRTKEKAHYFGSKFECEGIIGYNEIITRNDIDCLYIPLPTGLHEEWVIKALQGGKHVLVEKSFAMNFTSAKKMTEMALKNKLVVMENFMFQHHKQHKLVFDLISKNEIGEIRLLKSSFGFPPLPKDNFRYEKDLGGGCLLDAAAYTVKASSFILNGPINVESAVVYYDKERNIDIYGNASLMDNVGNVAQISFGFDNYYQCNYEIWGSQGKITATRAFTPQPNFKPSIIHEKQNYKEEHIIPEDNHFVNILKHFYNSVNEGNHIVCISEVLEQSRVLTDIIEKAKRKYINV